MKNIMKRNTKKDYMHKASLLRHLFNTNLTSKESHTSISVVKIQGLYGARNTPKATPVQKTK
jgi:hypothetical protein